MSKPAAPVKISIGISKKDIDTFDGLCETYGVNRTDMLAFAVATLPRHKPANLHCWFVRMMAPFKRGDYTPTCKISVWAEDATGAMKAACEQLEDWVPADAQLKPRRASVI